MPRIELKIAVIFHNRRGYESHSIMQEIGAFTKNHAYTDTKGQEHQINIYCIPNTEQGEVYGFHVGQASGLSRQFPIHEFQSRKTGCQSS